jgi:sodium/hydrogen antiporter
VAGSVFGTILTDGPAQWRDFAEDAGTMLSLSVWFIFGAVMVVPGLEDVTWRQVVFALAALTAVRMVPVALSLVGSGLDRASVLFVGWFGPRGLASIVFGLIAVDALHGTDERVVLGTVTTTILLSVVLHGITAGPGARRYGLAMAGVGHDRPEHAAVTPVAARGFARASAPRPGRVDGGT